jgi:exodeoxyribonuclease V beta subunit
MKSLQIEDFPLTGISLIEASAGTGKTWTIARLYLRALLERQLDVREILVVTFTHAATQELRGRIRQLLKALLDHVRLEGEEDPEDLGRYFAHWKNNRDAIERLQKALLDFDEAAIYSIHAFAQRAQGIYALETGALLTQELLEDESDLQRQAIRDYWRHKLHESDAPDIERLLANWSTPDKLLVSIEKLIPRHDAFDPDRERASLTAAGEDLKKIVEALRQEYRKIDLTKALIEDDAWNRKSININKARSLIKDIDCSGVLDIDALAGHQYNKYLRHTHLSGSIRKDRHPEYLDHDFFKLADRFLNSLEDLEKREKRCLMIESAHFVADAVRRIKERQQAISFDDQIRILEQALEGQNRLAGDLAGRWPLAMVDEFQDTDQYQYRIFRKIYLGRDETGLIMIGDPKQAIYSFRGADVFTYQKARQDAGPERQFTLAQNYRSTPELVAAVNAVFGQTDNPFIFDRLMRFHPVSAGLKDKRIRRGDEAVKPLAVMAMPWENRPANKDSANAYSSQRCADEIAALLGDGDMELIEAVGNGHPIRAGDIAVLVRTGSQGVMIRQALAARGIGSAMIQRDSVFASNEARELALLLEFLIDPADIDRMNGLLSTHLFGSNAREIAGLQRDDKRLIEWLETFKRYRQHWEQKGLMSMLLLLFEEQGSIQRQLKTDQGERRITNWMQLAELLQQESRSHPSLNHTLNWLLSRIEDSSPSEAHQILLESDRDLVRIMTIHKSKGLQFPVVFLPFAWDGSIGKPPDCYRVHDEKGDEQICLLEDGMQEQWHQEQLAEAVRLLYVALTRAEYRCYIGWAHVRNQACNALARCLYHEYIGPDNKDRLQLNLESAADYRRPWESLSDHVEWLDETEHKPPAEKQGDEQAPPEPLEFDRPLKQQWRVSSFTQMALGISGDSVELPEHDAWLEPGGPEETGITELRFRFEKGARAGNFLHDLLEHQDFTRPFDEGSLKMRCIAYGYDPEDAGELAEWLDELRQKDLDGLVLSSVAPQHKRAEMEFYLASNGLREEAINALLRKNGYLPGSRQLGFGEIRGFLKGYIDLVCQYDGRYFVIDYKSNHLGNRIEDYDDAACRAAMDAHDYHLQYLIYCLALHRHLRQRLPAYDYERDFGGVRYLFLRGITTKKDGRHGIFRHKPPFDVIERLDALFDGGEA